MMGSVTFFIVFFAAAVISVAIVIPQRSGETKYREKRQHSDECDNAQANLYEHDHGDDCMQIFYDHDQPFFNRLIWTEDFTYKYCHEWKCGEFVPEFLDDVISACGFDYMIVLSDFIAAACHTAFDRSYCELKWQFLDDIISNTDTTLTTQYLRCAGRNVTEEKCPTQCATALDAVISNVGCCYGELISINKRDNVGNFILNPDVFVDCNKTTPRPCT